MATVELITQLPMIAPREPESNKGDFGRVLVVADGDKAKANALATQLGEELVSMRGKTMPEFLSTREGVAAGLAFNAAPVVG